MRKFLFVALLLTSFSASAVSIPLIPVTNCASGGSQQICKPVGEDLVSCYTYPKSWRCYCNNPTVIAPSFTITAVPLRTTLTVEHCGVDTPLNWTCSSSDPNSCLAETNAYLRQFNAMNLKITSDNTNITYFYFITQNSIVIRRPDLGPITTVAIQDANLLLTYQAVIPGQVGCYLTLDFNTPDVDTKEQAQQLIANIQRDLDTQIALQYAYQDVLTFSGAYDYLRSIIDDFFIKLTNETIQNARTLFINNKETLHKVILDADPTKFTQEQRLALTNLYVSMFNLGVPTEWTNPDGTTKTLEQYLGSEATDVYNAVQEVSNRLGDYVTKYQDLYKAAGLAVEALNKKLALAQVQLASWLN